MADPITGQTFTTQQVAESDTRVTYSSNLFIGCTSTVEGAATSGGGLYVPYESNAVIKGNTFTDNFSSYSGGAVTIGDDTNKFATNSTISECLFVGNTAGASGGAAASYAGITTTKKVYYINSEFFDNYAATNGGSIFVSTANCSNFKNVTVKNSACGNNGGGLYIGGTVELSTVIVVGNTAGKNGGGIYDGSIITINKNSLIADNKAVNGGGVYGNSYRVTLSASTVSGNTATSNGGGVYSKSTKNSNPAITNSLITGNYAGGTGGGVFFVAGSSAGTASITGSTISYNTAKNFGAAVYTDCDTTIKDSLIIGNTSTNCSKLGGMIKAANNLTITGSLISENIGGRPIYATGNSVIIDGSTFSQNWGTAEDKGDSCWSGVMTYFVGNGVNTITNSLFAENKVHAKNSTAVGQGGALILYFDTQNTSMGISGSTFSNNFAGGSYGAIYVVRNSATTTDIACSFDDTSFIGNTAGAAHGGALGYGFDITLNNVNFQNNIAKTYGGGLSGASTAISTITGGTFSGNTAGTNGGAINSAGSLILSGVVFDGNYAKSKGGAIYASKNVNISDSQFLSASDSIYVYAATSSLTLAGTNTFAADIYSENAVAATGSTLIFANPEEIAVDAVITDPTAIIFSGEAVNFAQGQQFNAVTITVNCAMTQDIYKIATGNLGFEEGKTITIHDTTTGHDYTDIAINSEITGTEYSFKYENDVLKIVKGGLEEPSNNVTIAADIVDPKDNLYSLREAVEVYGFDGAKITFDTELAGPFVLESILTFSSGSYTVTGNGLEQTVIQGDVACAGTVEMNNLTIDGRITADTNGSAALNNVALTGGTFTGNGGSINVADKGQLVIDGGTFSGSEVTGNGGGIYWSDFSSSASTLGIKSTVSNAIITGNTVSSSAGGMRLGKNAFVVLDNVEISQNIAGGSGGGFSISASGLSADSANILVADNYAKSNGGGAYGATTLTFNAATFSRNHAEKSGGGFYNDGGTSVTVKSSIFNDNEAVANGGGLYNANKAVLIEAGTFSGNSAVYGGGLYNKGSNGATITDSLFTGNSVSKNGSALYNTTQMYISGSTISNNVAGGAVGLGSGANGGICNAGNTTLIIENSLIDSNRAQWDGAAIYGGGAYNVTGTVFNANTAHLGGAMFLGGNTTSDAIFTNCTFSGNVATREGVENTDSIGGAVYIYQTLSSDTGDFSRKVYFTNDVFSGNSSDGSAGAFYSNGILALKSGTASSTVTSTLSVDFTGSTFTENSAGASGGAVSTSWSTDSDVPDERLVIGGTVTLANNLFVNNHAINNGGAFYATNRDERAFGEVFVTNSTFSGNVAENKGGAIYNNAFMTISDSSFLTATDTIYNLASLTLTGTNNFAGNITSETVITVSGANIVLNDGAAIYVMTDEVQDLSGAAITVAGAAPGAAGALVAYGNLTFGQEQTFTVYGQTNVKVGDTFTVGEESYSLVYSTESKRLEVRFNAATPTQAGSITDDPSCKVGENDYAAKWNNSTSITEPVCAAGTSADANIFLQLDGIDVSGKTPADTMILAGAESGTRTGNNSVKLYSGTAGYVFGGGAVGSTDSGDIKFEVEGGAASQVFGGGMGNVSGNLEVDLLGGEVGTVNGGALNADVSGEIVMQLYGGTAETVNGGSRISSGEHTISHVTIEAAQNFTMNSGDNLFGAGMAIGNGSKLTYTKSGEEDTNPAVSIAVSGGNFGEATAGCGIFGGGFAGNFTGKNEQGGVVETGDVSISLTSGNVGNVFGGGWAQQGGAANGGNVSILVSGDEITGGNIYGGGAHSNSEKFSGNATKVDSVAITIAGNTGFESVFAGGQIDNTVGSDSVNGDAVITVSGTYADGFTTNLYGQGYNGIETVDGTSKLVLAGFKGSMTGKIADFDVVSISGNSQIDFTQANLNDQQNGWELDFTARTKSTDIAAAFKGASDDFISMLAAENLQTADSWKLFTADADSFGSGWSMEISYGESKVTAVLNGESFLLGDTTWELKGVSDNEEEPMTIILSKKVTTL